VPPLLEMQGAMRRNVVLGDKATIAAMLAAGVAADRLDIYRNTAVLTLTRALRLCFPAVEKLVGEQFFEGTAQHFVAEHPPRAACLDLYGDAYPDFLQALPQARLELAVSRALHAPDTESLHLAWLASVTAEALGRLRLTPEPSISLLHLRYPADAIWRAVLAGDDAALGAIDIGSGEVLLLIERQADGVHVARLPGDHWRFLEKLCAGKLMEEAIDESFDFDVPAALAEHLSLGRFTGFELAPPPLET
jgi:hypothetical protein